MTFSSLPADSPEQEWKEKTHTVDKSGLCSEQCGVLKEILGRSFPQSFSVAAEQAAASLLMPKLQSGIKAVTNYEAQSYYY